MLRDAPRIIEKYRNSESESSKFEPSGPLFRLHCTSQQKLDTKIEKIENRNEGLD